MPMMDNNLMATLELYEHDVMSKTFIQAKIYNYFICSLKQKQLTFKFKGIVSLRWSFYCDIYRLDLVMLALEYTYFESIN